MFQRKWKHLSKMKQRWILFGERSGTNKTFLSNRIIGSVCTWEKYTSVDLWFNVTHISVFAIIIKQDSFKDMAITLLLISTVNNRYSLPGILHSINLTADATDVRNQFTSTSLHFPIRRLNLKRHFHISFHSIRFRFSCRHMHFSSWIMNGSSSLNTRKSLRFLGVLKKIQGKLSYQPLIRHIEIKMK